MFYFCIKLIFGIRQETCILISTLDNFEVNQRPRYIYTKQVFNVYEKFNLFILIIIYKSLINN